MNNPKGELVLLSDIINNEVILVGYADITTKHQDKEYTKYIKDDINYWYQLEDNKLYTNEWDEITDFDINDYTKVQSEASLFSEEGEYPFEVSLYENNSKLTSANSKLNVAEEAVKTDGEVVKYYLPTIDRMINEVDNLNLNATRVEDGVEIVITKKDGTTETKK